MYKVIYIHNPLTYLNMLATMRAETTMLVDVIAASQVLKGRIVASHPEIMAFSVAVDERVSIKESKDNEPN